MKNMFDEINFAILQQKCQIEFCKPFFDRNKSEKHWYFLVEPIAKINPANKSLLFSAILLFLVALNYFGGMPVLPKI